MLAFRGTAKYIISQTLDDVTSVELCPFLPCLATLTQPLGQFFLLPPPPPFISIFLYRHCVFIPSFLHLTILNGVITPVFLWGTFAWIHCQNGAHVWYLPAEHIYTCTLEDFV